MFFCFFLFFLSLGALLLYNVHFILVLLLLEVVLLSLFSYLFFWYLGTFGLVGTFFFLLVMVCMGGFSVALLVSLSRGLGRDWWFLGFIF